MTESEKTVLRQSRDRRELKRTASGIAAREVPADLEVLGRHLATADFLGRLDAPEDYQGAYAGLRLARVIKVLMDNRRSAADAVLLSLIGAGDFQAHVLRMQLLVRALAVVKPSPSEAITYWDSLSQAGSPLAFDVAEALCVNQSDPAMGLLERKFADTAHDPDQKLAWMRQLVLPRRNDVPILACCERLLLRSLPVKLQPSLVEALFDYKPEEWYRDCSPPRPPLRAQATQPARDLLRRLAEHALKNVALNEEQKAKVKLALKELGGSSGAA